MKTFKHFRSLPVHFTDDGGHKFLDLADTQHFLRRLGFLQSVHPPKLVRSALWDKSRILRSTFLSLFFIVIFDDILLMRPGFLALVFHPLWCE